MTDESARPDAGEVSYRFADFVLDPGRGNLSRHGKQLALRPKSFRVLQYLLQHAGQLVTREQLHTEVWGDTIVTDDAITQCVLDIRRALDDRQQKLLRTLPRRGYMLDVVVDAGSSKATASRRAGRARVLALLAGFAVLAGGWWLTQPNRPAQQSPYAIAVLPFEDMSEAGTLGFFGDGLAEEILNHLARSPELVVMSRTSSFSFRDGIADVQEIARRLAVTHVLEGSVRDEGETIRVTAQLVDANSGGHLWSETYDRTLDDIFDVQDEISRQVFRRLTDALDINLPAAQRTDPEAFSLFLQANHLLNYQFENRRAATLLTKALEIDPTYAPAWRELSRAQWRELGNADSLAAAIREMRQTLDRALELNPDDPGTLAYMGWHQMDFFGDITGAKRYFERALAIDPNHEDALRPAILFAIAVGDVSGAVGLGEHAVRTNPVCRHCMFNLAEAYALAGQHSRAEAALARIVDLFEGGLGRYGVGLLLNGKPEQALELFASEEDSSWRRFVVAMAQFELASEAVFRQSLQQFVQHPRSPGTWNMARAYAWTGAKDEAFAALDDVIALSQVWSEGRLVRRGLMDIGIYLRHPMLKPLHSDPRWQDLMRRQGLAEEQLAGMGLDFTLNR